MYLDPINDIIATHTRIYVCTPDDVPRNPRDISLASSMLIYGYGHVPIAVEEMDADITKKDIAHARAGIWKKDSESRPSCYRRTRPTVCFNISELSTEREFQIVTSK